MSSTLSAEWISYTFFAQPPLIKPTLWDTDAHEEPKKGWVYLASPPFDVLPFSSPLPPSLVLNPLLSSGTALQIRKCFALPKVWKYLQGHCKHSKQGTTPLSRTWLMSGTEIHGMLLLTRAANLRGKKREKGNSIKNVKPIQRCLCFHVKLPVSPPRISTENICCYALFSLTCENFLEYDKTSAHHRLSKISKGQTESLKTQKQWDK